MHVTFTPESLSGCLKSVSHSKALIDYSLPDLVPKNPVTKRHTPSGTQVGWTFLLTPHDTGKSLFTSASFTWVCIHFKLSLPQVSVQSVCRPIHTSSLVPPCYFVEYSEYFLAILSSTSIPWNARCSWYSSRLIPERKFKLLFLFMFATFLSKTKSFPFVSFCVRRVYFGSFAAAVGISPHSWWYSTFLTVFYILDGILRSWHNLHSWRILNSWCNRHFWYILHSLHSTFLNRLQCTLRHEPLLLSMALLRKRLKGILHVFHLGLM